MNILKKLSANLPAEGFTFVIPEGLLTGITVDLAEDYIQLENAELIASADGKTYKFTEISLKVDRITAIGIIPC